MSFWNLIGGFALFNVVCNMFSSKQKRTYAPPRQLYRDYDHDDYMELCADIDALQNRVVELQLRLDDTDVMSDHDDYLELGADESDIDVLQNRVVELQLRLDDTDVMSDHYDELQDSIDELQDRIDFLEEWEDIQDELEDLRDELDDLEFDRDLYDDHDDW